MSMDNELSRVEALASKLGHGIFEVRLRSASNLLFKLNNKVIDQGVLNLPMAVKMISSGVLEGLQLFMLSAAHEPSNDVDTHSSETIPKTKIENNEFLAVLLKITIHLVNNSEFIEPRDMSDILDQVMSIADSQENTQDPRKMMLSDLKALLDETISSITSIKMNDSEKNHTSTEHDTFEIDVPVSPTRDIDGTTPDDFYQDTSLPEYSEDSGAKATKTNAGVILDSKLCTDGFKFPNTILTDVDEKFLFDVDVKLKMDGQQLHDSRLLFDMLVDYPVSVIISRKTLLSHVLDCIGAALYTADKNYDQPLTPMEAMEWMVKFLEKAQRAFMAQLDGSICANVPKAYEDALIDVGADDGNNPDPNSLSKQLAINMYKMRVPIIPFENNCATVTSSSPLATMFTGRIPPSLPGIAFAACAAALPLLKLRSTILCESVHKLFRTALPLIFEPDLHVFDAHGRSLCPLDLERLQHLLKRCSQIVEFHHYQPFALLNSRDDKILHCDLIIINVLVMILDLIPKDPTEMTTTPTLNVDENLRSFLLSVCCSHLLIGTDVSFLQKAKVILCALCPAKAYDVKEANESLVAVDRLVSITEDPWQIRNNPDMLRTESFLHDLSRALSVLENASHDKNENIRSAVLVSLEALISLDDENVLIQVASMIEQLLTVCGPLTRSATIDFIAHTNNQALFVTLATPTVVASLVTEEILGNCDPRTLNQNALKVVESLLSETIVLCDEMNVAQPDGQIDELLCDWCDLLTPLKLVVWIPQINQSWPVIEMFTDRLEDLCSQLFALKDQYYRHLVTGMFHTDMNIRASCSTRLRHHFHIPGDIRDNSNTAESEDSSPSSIADPFYKRLKLYSPSSSPLPFFKSSLLEGTTVSHTRTVLPSLDTSESTFEHKDIRKLADIGLLGDFDLAIRLSAMHQLVSIAVADKHLIRTIERPWCMKVVNASLMVISEYSDGILHASLTQEEKDLLSLSLTFIALVVQSSREIRQSVDFTSDENTESSINMNILLKIFLSAYSSPSNVVTDYFDNVWCKCGIILSSIILHVDTWEVSKAYTYRTSRQVKADDVVLITPSYLLSLFITIGMNEDSIQYDSSSGEDGVEVFRLAVVPAVPVTTNGVSDENRDMLTCVLDKSSSQSILSMAVNVVLAINDAQSSSQLLSALAMAASLVTMYSTEALNNLLEEGFMTALHKYLTTCPTSNKDLFILCAIFNVLSEFIDMGMKVKAMNNSDGMRHMIDSVLDSLVGPLSPLLACGKGDHPSKAKYYLQASLVRMFMVITNHKPSKEIISDFLIDSSMVKIFNDVLLSEATAPSLRSMCGNALELLVMNGFTSLRDSTSISAPHSRSMGLRTNYDDVISLSRLLRPPDVFRYTSVLVSSLKLLAIAQTIGGSVTTGRDWKYITRYVYDRRGEVRLLALEIMDNIINEGEELLRSDDNVDTTPDAILLRILLDPSEAQAVRYKAGTMYVKYYAQSGVDMELGQLFRGLLDGASSSSSPSCSPFGMMKMAMLISHLLANTVHEGEYNTSTILDILTPLKGIQSIVSLLAPDVVFQQAEAALSRIGYCSMDSNEEYGTYPFEQTSKYLVAEIERSLLNIPFEHTGYQKIWMEVKLKSYTRLLECRTYAARALISASSLNPALFTDLIRNTTLVRNIVSSISKVYITPKNKLKTVLGMNLDMSFSALCDLLTLMINSDSCNKDGNGRVGITALVTRDSLIPASITASISRMLSNCTLGEERTNIMVLSCLRLFSNLLNDEKWRNGLGIGGNTKESSEPSQNVMRLLQAMIEIRASGDCTDALLLAIDVTLSLLTQYSYHIRSVLIKTDNFVKSVVGDVKYIVQHYALTSEEVKKLPKSGDGDEENSVTTSNTSKISRATDKFREKTRGYTLNSKNSPSKTQVKKDPMTDAARLRLWSSLILLKSVCHGCEDAQLFLHELNIQHTMSRLLKVVSSTSANIDNNTSIVSTTLRHRKRDLWTSWVPSDSHISAVVLALYASLSFNNHAAKKAIASAVESRITNRGASKAGSTLHQMVSLGLSPGIHQPFRLLCLALAGGLVKEPSHNLLQSKAQSSIVAKTLGVALCSLLKGNNSNLEDTVFLLDALSNCICSGQSIFASGDPNRRAKEALPSADERAFIVDMSDHTQLLSLPEIIKWVYDKHSKSDIVMAALLRMIGGIAEKGGKNKRILANIKGEESVKIIVDIIKAVKVDENRNKALTPIALMALWSLLYNNESTRGILRKLQVDYQSLLGDDDEKDFGHHRSVFANEVQVSEDSDVESTIVSRAKKALRILLQ